MGWKSYLLPSLAILASSHAQAQTQVPRRIGDCVSTTIKSVETRLVEGPTNKPIPGSGSAVSFANGLYQVSYDTIPAYCDHFGLKQDRAATERESLEWSTTRGSRSGRTAWQYVQDLAGRLGVKLA